MKTKVCNQCKEVKLKTEFSKRPDSLTGYHGICKVCRRKNNREYQRIYREENRKKYRAYMKTWRKENAEKVKEYKKQKRKNENNKRLSR